MIGSDFTGVGKYGDAYIVKAKPIHAETLQHQLRPTDARECMIAGVTPWRALMSAFSDKQHETYTALVDDQPVMMFGVVPEHELVGSIWMLCNDVVDKYPKTFLKFSPAIVEHFQSKYFLLQNVCPVDHYKTLTWLGYLGFMIQPKIIKQNGYDVLRFVRCQETEYVNMYGYTQPGIS